MQYLPVQIPHLDYIPVYQTHLPYPGAGKVCSCRTSQPACAYYQD